MAWDPAQPATNAPLLSAPIRENFAALNGLAVGGVINPMTTPGDLIVGGVAGAPGRLGVGTNGHVLTLAAGVPTWAAAAGGVTYPLLAPDGTAAAPSYSFAGATGTGVFRNHFGGNDLDLVYNFTPHLFINANTVALSNANLIWYPADNAHDIGTSASGRPRTIYVGTSIVAPLFAVGISLNFAIPTVPGTPAASTAVLYQKSDKRPYWKDDAGLETALVGGTGVTNIVALTQAAYDALTPKVATTLYVITP